MVVIEDVVSAAATSLTIVPAGANRKLYVAVLQDAAGNAANTPGATFKSTETYTQIAESVDINGFYLAVLVCDTEPTAGSGTIQTSGVAGAFCMAIALSNVGQAASHDGIEQAEANTSEATLGIASAANDLVLGFFACNNKTAGFFTATGDTPTEHEDFGDGALGGALVTCPGAAGDVNIGGSWTGAVKNTLIALNVKAAGRNPMFNNYMSVKVGDGMSTNERIR